MIVGLRHQRSRTKRPHRVRAAADSAEVTGVAGVGRTCSTVLTPTSHLSRFRGRASLARV